jgi:hypothetical protein
MRRRIFVKAVEEFHKVLVGHLVLNDIDPETASDVVQSMVQRTLDSKAYNRITHETIDWRMRSYLMQATRWELSREMNRQSFEGACIGQFGEETDEGDTFATLRDEPTLEDIVVCPFCHVGVLNEFGACALCHTILGKSKGPSQHVTMEQIIESDCPDLGMFADVNLALAKLDDIERKVVHHIVQGNESLEDLAELTRISHSTLGRIWSRAKAKLQQELYEYSHVNPV